MLWFDPFLSVSGELLNLTKALSETLVDLLCHVFQESTGGTYGIEKTFERWPESVPGAFFVYFLRHTMSSR